MELGARLARAPYLAVTGTNGKTTTTGMLAACLRAAGLDAVACGNIGRPFPTAAREPHDALVVEVSSFQLATQTSFHPRVSVLLNLAPDHLDWHGSFDAYAAAKARVFALQGAGDVHVGNLDDEAAAAISRSAPCEVRWFTLGEPADDGAGFRDGRLTAGWSGADLGALAVDTPAMRADAAAAATAAHAFGVGDDAIAEGIAVVRARTPPGRVGRHRRRRSVRRQLEGDEPARDDRRGRRGRRGRPDRGGRRQGHRPVPARVARTSPRRRVAIGSSAAEVRAVFEGRVPVRDAGSIEEATRLAFAMASAGGTVLLAPACASWDMFRDYAERGDRFAAAARALEKQDART